MGILQRMVSMTKAAANEMLDKIENPVMMLNHYLRDLDEEIAGTERAMLKQQAQERMLETKLAEQNGHADYYESKAEQAASGDREAEARTALESKLLYLEQAAETARLLQLAKQAALELGQRAETLKEERTRLQSKRTELISRVQKTGGSHGYSSPDSLRESSASRGFERIEQKVMEWEAARELAGKPYGDGANTGLPAADMQREQRSALVDEELKRLLQKKSGS
ncbi:PspA/IM30 family protein [Paenibacillus harenae]|uniref:PspA/IM30 family protein n=1 Tax=Paenibacillus harenae TaxID=306543 RepID=UPI000424AF8E|nr:PspA/IM30 family protein [Paenibacillus harenae]